jgi:hypothetical protein
MMKTKTQSKPEKIALMSDQKLEENETEVPRIVTDMWEAILGDSWINCTAQTLDEAKKLVEAGFEYITDVEGAKLFRKPKC